MVSSNAGVAMGLAADIDNLRDTIIKDLTEVHDYYTNTKQAWRVVQRLITRGTHIRFENRATGTITDETRLPAISHHYVTRYLVSATFQEFVSLFEDFLFGLMRSWLLAFPQRLSDKQVSGSVVFAAADLDSVKVALVEAKLNEIRYQKVRDWFAELEKMVKVGCPTVDQIDRLAEIKASRDVLVHNRGVANRIYEEKAGKQKRFVAGQKLEIPEAYHRESWQLIWTVVQDLSAAAVSKAPT